MEYPHMNIQSLMRVINSHLLHLYEINDDTHDIEALLDLMYYLQYLLVMEGILEESDCF